MIACHQTHLHKLRRRGNLFERVTHTSNQRFPQTMHTLYDLLVIVCAVRECPFDSIIWTCRPDLLLPNNKKEAISLILMGCFVLGDGRSDRKERRFYGPMRTTDYGQIKEIQPLVKSLFKKIYFH